MMHIMDGSRNSEVEFMHYIKIKYVQINEVKQQYYFKWDQNNFFCKILRFCNKFLKTTLPPRLPNPMTVHKRQARFLLVLNLTATNNSNIHCNS